MSVSLEEVLENAGYDIRNDLEDAKWLISQYDEFEELCDIASDTIDKIEDEMEDEDECY